ncbi:MAG: trypsin-like peptidase domain-containing protein [Pseudomonadota bacterium]
MLETNDGGCLEAVEGFRPQRALTETFRPARIPSSAFYGYGAWSVSSRKTSDLAADARLETVHGLDDRVIVKDTSRPPWRCIVQIITQMNNGEMRYGTGWLAGPRTVVTAAHCLAEPVKDIGAEEITMVPGRNDEVAPYGFIKSKHWAISKAWRGRPTPGADFGAITIPLKTKNEDLWPTGEELGWFGIGVAEDKTLDRMLVNTAGYPLEREKPFGSLWFNAGRINKVESHELHYMIDTEGGHSGSPVFFYDQTREERIVVGIHTTGYYPNRGIRIVGQTFREILGWILNPPTSNAKTYGISSAAY